ncbi:transcriptional regulator [Rathayibacter iranicus]|uniref:Helix-turn-helix domain-containing protein n=2 Tax=Rathayibacter iranicus TaxID=59737 RepID=A0AAD1AEG7_9MICO|nr:helix-turn-helix domain-containing protein [Rathayibacter iranicus]MWV29706.1 helix-turn-helix domain-containing protein [Rathayibacter iranicus NCPPB 2253 = VKM Ac-1602]PPI41551.1 transcriptional regulator [Rathayibacter iranicus]PPI57493.1 transcriptional regulator [Rathayibacter iranicus]PPI68367.1 transcriptional regulator [Rathayibacter iranicus]
MFMSHERGTIIRSASGVGALVAESRAGQGLTQAQLAERAGVTREWLNRFEAGSPSVTLFRVMRVLRELRLEVVVRAADTRDNG